MLNYITNIINCGFLTHLSFTPDFYSHSMPNFFIHIHSYSFIFTASLIFFYGFFLHFTLPLNFNTKYIRLHLNDYSPPFYVYFTYFINYALSLGCGQIITINQVKGTGADAGRQPTMSAPGIKGKGPRPGSSLAALYTRFPRSWFTSA
jgi:hypothetical protein